MPLPEGLLNPIPGENPSGQSLRYDPVYDKIREARRADEELQLSEEASKRDVWGHTIKKPISYRLSSSPRKLSPNGQKTCKSRLG